MLAAICYPHTNLPEAQLLDRVRRLPADDRIALRARVRRRSQQPSPQARPRVRAHRLPLRRARRLRRVPRPAAAPHAHDRVAAALDRATATTFPSRSLDAGLDARFDDAMERSAALLRRVGRALPRAGRVRGVARVPDALRDADERARGDAPAASCAARRRVIRATAASRRRCTGSSRSRPAPRDRGRDALRRPRRQRARTTRRRTRGRSATRRAQLTRVARRNRACAYRTVSARSCARSRRARVHISRAKNPNGVDLHRRASVLVIVARYGLTAMAVAEAYYSTPPASTAVVVSYACTARGRGSIKGVRRLSRRLSRERCDNPSATGSSGHPAAPPVSWTRPSDSPPAPPSDGLRARGGRGVKDAARAALYSAPPSGLHVPGTPRREAFRRFRGWSATARFFSHRGHRAR